MKIRIVILAFAVASIDALALSPPWWTLQKKIAATVGKDSSVQVDQLDMSGMPYVVNIRVSDPAKANALAAVLIPKHEMGNVTVEVRVEGAAQWTPATAEEIATALRTAFEANPLFITAYETTRARKSATAAIFTRTIVQFFNDDISDVYGNYNAPASATFKDILINEGVWFGTVPFESSKSVEASSTTR